MKNKKLFEAAERYEFDQLRNYIEQGGSVNICNEEGHSLLTRFIQGYFECGERGFQQDMAAVDDVEGFMAEEHELLKMLLEKRQSTVGLSGCFRRMKY